MHNLSLGGRWGHYAAMPEGHTIHRLARDLNATLRPGTIVASSPQGRFAAGAEQIDGAELAKAEAYGKHLFLNFEHAATVHVHLGLIGKFKKKKVDSPVRGQIRLRLEGAEQLWDLTGPMVCKLIDPTDITDITGPLGPDPLRRDGSAERFVELLGRRRLAIAAALLNQEVIAGVGNVYRSEFCFLLGIDPTTPANALADGQPEQLWDLAKEQLQRGVKLNRITTRDTDEVGKSAGRISGDDRLYVYKRAGKPCHRCTTTIERVEIGQRKAWWCPGCQGS